MNQIEQLQCLVTGVVPLIQRNVHLADPRNEFVKAIKEISSKRKKSDMDQIELLHLDFLGGLYLNSQGQVIIPSDVIEATLKEAAKRNKLGKIFDASIFCEDSILKYEGSSDPESLWLDKRFSFTTPVNIRGSRTLRCRPRFFPWSASLIINYYPDQVNLSQIKQALEVAGRLVGFCDWRPKYGRFEVSYTK